MSTPATSSEPSSSPATPAPASSADDRVRNRNVLARYLSRPEIGALFGVLAIAVFFLLVAEPFRHMANTGTILYQSATIGIMAVPVALLMVAGEFDLSAGVAVTTAGLSASLLAWYFNFHVWAAVGLSLLIALAIGALNGFMLNRSGLPSFLITLATFFVLQGVNLGVTRSVTGGVASNDISDMAGFDSAHAFFAASMKIGPVNLKIPVLFWIVLTIIAGLVVLAMTGDNHFSDLTHLEGPDGSPLVPSMDTTAFVGAMLAAFYAFTGFEGAGSAASEMEDPARNLPRAIPIGVAVVIVVYVAVVSVAMMINPTGVLESKDAVVLASAFDNSIVRDLIVLGALVSMFGINVAASFNTPRIFDAMSRRRMLPAAASRTSQRGVPVVAFVVTAVLAIVVPMAFGYSMRGTMVISSVTRFVQFVMVPLALILCFLGRTRHRPNDVKRSVVLDVVFPILSIAASVFLMVEFDWRGQFSNPGGGLNLWAVAAMIVGYVVLPAALYLPWKLGVYDDTPKQLPKDR
mgnify:CR=1 FL=1